MKTETFDVIVSLGSNCTIAHQLRWNLLRTASFPFDWLITPQTTKVHSLIKNEFAGFLNRENIEELSPYPLRGRFVDREWDATFTHDFIPNGLDIQYGYVFEKYRVRALRFMEMLKSRKRCLFIRKQSDKDLLRESVALGEFLRGFNKENCLYSITNNESERLRIEQISDGIFCVEMSHKSDTLSNFEERLWEGNDKVQ